MRAEALSILDWWQLAGVDVSVDDVPRDWLAKTKTQTQTQTQTQPKPASATTARAADTAAPVAEPAAPTDTLEALGALLAAAAVTGGGGERVAPAGNPGAGLMLLADMPDMAGDAAGSLRAGPMAMLFDRMLAAIGRDRASIYLAEIVPQRPTGGRIAGGDIARFRGLALDHIHLAAPRLLLLLGDGATQAMLGMPLAKARGRLHELNHRGTTYKAIATFHPRFLFQRPGQKPDAWADLRLALREIGQ